MILWRIATDTRKYSADDLTGGGAANAPGRWNAATEPVIYCACTIAVAVLETAAHVDDSGLPQNKYLVEIQVPDDVWKRSQKLIVARLPNTWDAIPAGMGSVKVGSAWISGMHSAILLVPSVIVPEEWACLINPRHPDAARIAAKVIRRIDYNRLFRK